MLDDRDTQISLTWNDMQINRVEQNYCEGCKTKELRNMIDDMVGELVGKKLINILAHRMSDITRIF